MRETDFMASIPALVEPEMIAWARRRANLEPLAATRRIKLALLVSAMAVSRRRIGLALHLFVLGKPRASGIFAEMPLRSA